MKPLIISYSFTGNNEALTQNLKKRFNCEEYRVTELKKPIGPSILLDFFIKRPPKVARADINWQAYDYFILVAPIWESGVASPMRVFIEQERDHLTNYSFITICGGEESQAEKILNQLVTAAGRAPKAFCELKVNDLLPSGHHQQARFKTFYKIEHGDLKVFDDKISQFVKETGQV
ncbi:MAG: NAD(P)H-dependent oxidoreductase [Bacteroidetes bacterium]|nr:NAD(P)H-dependent oxidoreductase [Bacteroidota bacterium]